MYVCVCFCPSLCLWFVCGVVCTFRKVNLSTLPVFSIHWCILTLYIFSWSAYCPTLTKECKWQITQVLESDVFRLDLACSTSNSNFDEQKHWSCWKIFKARHNDIALMSMYMIGTFCWFMRNFIFKRCFILSEYGRILILSSCQFCQTSAFFFSISFHFHLS